MLSKRKRSKNSANYDLVSLTTIPTIIRKYRTLCKNLQMQFRSLSSELCIHLAHCKPLCLQESEDSNYRFPVQGGMMIMIAVIFTTLLQLKFILYVDYLF